MRVSRRAQEIVGFAVVDLETTGLSTLTDRVVEAAIVQVDADGQITDEFSTLINPCRDVGPTRIHGIKAGDVARAPLFADAAATMWQLLSGRVLVAHNAGFDVRFLEAELNRCGASLPPPPVMCTMRLARKYLPGLPARTLAACCQAASIKLADQHSALGDARSAARSGPLPFGSPAASRIVEHDSHAGSRDIVAARSTPARVPPGDAGTVGPPWRTRPGSGAGCGTA